MVTSFYGLGSCLQGHTTGMRSMLPAGKGTRRWLPASGSPPGFELPVVGVHSNWVTSRVRK